MSGEMILLAAILLAQLAIAASLHGIRAMLRRIERDRK